MSVERVAGSPWNQWPDVHGIGGRMAVESATKWLMKGQFEMEARLMLQKRSRDASNHFLDAEATFGVESEPVGLLAGRLR